MVPRLRGLGTILVFGIGHISGVSYVQGLFSISIRLYRVVADKVAISSGWYLTRRPICTYGSPVFCALHEFQGANRIAPGFRPPRPVSTTWIQDKWLKSAQITTADGHSGKVKRSLAMYAGELGKA